MATFGDVPGLKGKLNGNTIGGNQTLVGDLVYGDAFSISGRALGGSDCITGLSDTGFDETFANVLFGDSELMSGNTRGGGDTIAGGSGTSVTNTLYRDAHLMSGNS